MVTLAGGGGAPTGERQIANKIAKGNFIIQMDTLSLLGDSKLRDYEGSATTKVLCVLKSSLNRWFNVENRYGVVGVRNTPSITGTGT